VQLVELDRAERRRRQRVIRRQLLFPGRRRVRPSRDDVVENVRRWTCVADGRPAKRVLLGLGRQELEHSDTASHVANRDFGTRVRNVARVGRVVRETSRRARHLLDRQTQSELFRRHVIKPKFAAQRGHAHHIEVRQHRQTGQPAGRYTLRCLLYIYNIQYLCTMWFRAQ